MIPKHNDLVHSIKGPPPVPSAAKRPTAGAEPVQAVRYNVRVATSMLQQCVAQPLLPASGAAPASPTSPGPAQGALENLRVCTFERTAECAAPPARLRPLDPPPDAKAAKRGRRPPRHALRYAVEGSGGAQATAVPVGEYEELQCLLLFLPDGVPASAAGADVTTVPRAAEVVPLTQPLYLLRGERTKDAATSGEGISDAWQEVNQVSGGRFNKRDWKTMDELDRAGEETGGFASRGKVNSDVAAYDGDGDDGTVPRPRGGGKSKPAATKAPPPAKAKSAGAREPAPLPPPTSSPLELAPAAPPPPPPSAAEPPKKVLKLGEALRKNVPAPAPATAADPRAAGPVMDAAADEAALPSVAAAHIRTLLHAAPAPAERAAVVVPLRELEQKILKQLPSYPAVAAMFRDRAQAGAATAWFKGLRVQLHVYLKSQRYHMDPQDNVTLSPP
ncbi:hypothetical protein STCU_12168 [Strigomonas culicis]|uniref:Uncharacterized protein n=1 Tax=Strigomonas culicis TaxID=28005 RepID=S9TG04_9TRYP|nr:hypothetical protein STCU_12168 [Strigomonas culicis]|eukprot:EPY15278.1 hypothetical protein STCU_12168 [Strigomonas culicis]